MTKNDALMTRARRVDPMPTNPFKGFADSPEAQEILNEILQTPADVQSARRSPRRRSIAGLVAAAVLASAGAVAAGVAMSRPDPQQSAQVERDFSSQAEVHLTGWRPELDAESVWCLFPETEGPLDTYAAEFPLDEPLTPARLARECTEGNDWAQKLTQDGVGPFAVSTATICVTEEGTYPKTVIGVGGIDCASTPIRELVPDVDAPVYKYTDARTMTTEDLEQLNFMRAVEVAVLAVPADDQCPSSEQATEWARARLEEYGIKDLQVRKLGEGEGCYRGRISWNTGFSSDTGEVRIDVAGNQP